MPVSPEGDPYPIPGVTTAPDSQPHYASDFLGSVSPSPQPDIPPGPLGGREFDIVRAPDLQLARGIGKAAGPGGDPDGTPAGGRPDDAKEEGVHPLGVPPADVPATPGPGGVGGMEPPDNREGQTGEPRHPEDQKILGIVQRYYKGLPKQYGIAFLDPEILEQGPISERQTLLEATYLVFNGDKAKVLVTKRGTYDFGSIAGEIDPDSLPQVMEDLKESLVNEGYNVDSASSAMTAYERETANGTEVMGILRESRSSGPVWRLTRPPEGENGDPTPPAPPDRSSAANPGSDRDDSTIDGPSTLNAEQEEPLSDAVSLTDLRQQMTVVAKDVDSGISVIVTNHGNPNAHLVPYKEPEGEEADPEGDYDTRTMLEFRLHAGEFVKTVNETGKRILITKNGHPRLWVVPVEISEGEHAYSKYPMKWFNVYGASVVDGVVRTGTPAQITKQGRSQIWVVRVEEGEVVPEDAKRTMRQLNQYTADTVDHVVTTREAIYITRHGNVKVKFIPVDNESARVVTGRDDSRDPGNIFP